MNDLDKRIAGDWYDIRQVIDDRHGFEDCLKVDEEQTTSLLQELRLSVERGTVELKRKALNGIHAFVESQQFDSRSFRDIDLHIDSMLKAIYLALLQRAFCSGGLMPKRRTPVGPAAEVEVPQVEVNTIIANVQQRIAKDQSLRNAGPVKNILYQVERYRLEVANMKELAPNIPKEKSAAFTANFKKSFDEITQKIRENYAVLLRSEQKPSKPTVRRSMFERFDLRPLAAFFATQAQEFSRVRSILEYARKERFKTREILSGILEKREASLALVERELKEYERFSFGHGEELAREFAAEVADYLGRGSRDEPDEEWV